MALEIDPPPALGRVVEEERGSLPFALVHGESLVACAAFALAAAGITAVDASVTWAGVQESGEAFVLHDALCPLTPPEFLAGCLAEALADDAVVVGVRPVTDTVKRVVDDADGRSLTETLDRARLLEVWSPIVLPPSVVARTDRPDARSFARLVGSLRETADVRWREAPPEARRVALAEDLRLLEAVTTRR